MRIEEYRILRRYGREAIRKSVVAIRPVSPELLSWSPDMLHFGTDSRVTNRRSASEHVLSPAEFIAACNVFVRRQMPILISAPLLIVAIALLYLAVATPKFTAEALLLVEAKRSDQSTPTPGDAGIQVPILDSQVEILKSEKIALSVIRDLKLTTDPEFVGPGNGVVGRVMGLISLILGSGPDTEFSRTRRALERFDRRLTVKRIGITYVISIQFESPSAERAAEIANAVARAYTADQMEANYESARIATEWLQGRVDALHNKASNAQQAVTDRKAAQPSSNQAQLELRDLEISAQAYRRLYDTFLQRYLESAEQQSFPASQGRLMTVASPPVRPSSPKTFLILAVSIAGGIFAGIGLGLLRDVSDQTFRTRDKVLAELDADCIGVIPAAIAESPASGPRNAKAIPTRAKSRTIVGADSLMRNIADAPRSQFSESFRAVKLAVDIMARGGKRLQVIGVTSALPNEGKSTVAASLAQLMAQGGDRTILLDCDLRNPSLSSTLAPNAALGILDVTSGRARLDDATWIDPSTHLHFLPATNSSQLVYTSEVLASEEMGGLFKTLRETYEYVIVDLSPVAPFVDVRTAVHLMDSFIFVIEWGRTNIDVVKKSLDVANDVYGNLIGVALNKADMSALRRYGEVFETYPEQHPQELRVL
ncbi:Wzz/FepE/Etk N-terminal domain-containing protein [Bradyrhizobium sp. DASA03120]|uniref:Wzz/FepE/Etk N-terminal domain-containing protein n=1 Tax=Bradyrhizobium sp. SMVTL-02 TaxID=3395917 RepID=UPI003F72D9C4